MPYEQEDIENSNSSVTIVSRGSRPVSLAQWADSDFLPIPVKIVAEPIVALLTPLNLVVPIYTSFILEIATDKCMMH